MKFIFLFAFVYLLIEFLNRKAKDSANKNKLNEILDKATDTMDKAVENTKEALSTPAKKSVVNVQSLDTVLPSPLVQETIEEASVKEKEIKKEHLYASSNESTSKHEKAAEGIVTIHERIAIDSMSTEVSVEDEVTEILNSEVEEEETY